MYLFVCGLALRICVVVTLEKSDNIIINRQLLGIQSCFELCSTFDGCHFPNYDTVTLRCRLEVVAIVGRICDGRPITKTCTVRTRYSRTIYSRRKGLKNVTVSVYMKAEVKGPTCTREPATVDQTITLHQACREGKHCVVQSLLLERPTDINFRGKLGRTPVMSAALKGQVAVYDFLVGRGCDLSVRDSNKNTVLHLACAGGNADIVSNLVVNQNYDVNSKGKFGWTPVMIASRYGFIEVFTVLMSKDCNVTIIDGRSNNILHAACVGGHVELVKHILSKGIINIDSKGEVGRTAVMIAAFYGHTEVVRLLFSFGCKQTLVDNHSDNILHVACLGGHVHVVKYILTLNIYNVESKGALGGTPILRAASWGHITVVDFLVNTGCNLTAVDDMMDNILHVACLNNQVNMVEHILFHYEFDINCRGGFGRTPVMVAAYIGGIQVLKFLEAKGCDFEKLDSLGNNILFVASSVGHLDIVTHILSKKMFNIDSRGEFGRTAAMKAAMRSHIEVFKYLGDRGSNLTLVDYQGNNILHLVCAFGNIVMVKYILSQEIQDIESRGQTGRTPLMNAVAYSGNVEIIQLLLSKGCNYKAKDFGSNNILHIACSVGRGDKTAIVKYLLTLQYAENMKWARNEEGKTPLKLAEQKGNARLVTLLKGGI